MAGSGRSGAALIITLAFMVLLATVMIIFFTQALSFRQQSNGNFNDFKSAALAQSALETVVGDLRQEIANGSTNYAYANSSGVTNNFLSIPTNNLFVVPQRSGNPAYVNGGDPTPNLIRISVRSDSITYPGVASRASAVSSTNAASSGQYISLARWNKHYLLPRGTSSAGVSLAGTTNVDTTPTNSFSAPDWVYVTSQGPQVLTTPTSTTIGRYAYAIYDEGGLLDANVVGVPSNMATNTAPDPVTGTTLPAWGSGLKGSEAFADLTVTNAITQAPMFAQTNIDEIVGWRDYATAKPSGNFTNGYTFSATQAATYHDAVVNNTNGFLVTSGNTFTDPTSGNIDTDQAFTSRQSLINFAITAGIPQDSLQYLATFTRDTEQPSYNPPVGRPMVQNNTNTAANVAPFGTGNSAYGVDRASTVTNSPSDINPPFLNVRVTTSFTRTYGDGKIAQAGEPLIKERFPLSRLSNIPTFPATGAGISATQANYIFQYFGLRYNNAYGGADPTQPEWFYNQDGASTASIDRLSTVSTQGREPNFFELLKAAINVGSVGKGAAYTGFGTGGTEGTLVQARDVLSDLQILQIGANIIDQSKADNFPTSIQFSGDSTIPPNVVRGSEDLPYLYRVRNWVSHYYTPPAASTAQPMMGALFWQPELWDPYSYNAAASSGLGSSGFIPKTSTPSKFRVRMSQDPSVTPPSTPLIFSMAYNLTRLPYTDLSSYVTLNAPLYTAGPPAPLIFNAGELNGSPPFWGFREPTLLGVSTMPARANLATTPYTDVNTGLNMTGLLLANFPWDSSPSATTDYAYQFYIYNSGNASVYFYVEYQDASGAWHTYDESPFEPPLTGAAIDLHTVMNYTQYNSGTFAKEAMVNLDWYGAGRTDPRTGRWGLFYGEYFQDIPIIDAANNVYASDRGDGNISSPGYHNGSVTDAGFVTDFLNYGQNFRGFEHGYWAENSVRSTFQNPPGLPAYDSFLEGAGPYYRYNRDPDGVARRAMAGYVTDTANGGTAAQFNQPLTGLPLAIASATDPSGPISVNNFFLGANTSAVSPAYGSRPTILHRPFRSVAELGYAFRDTPWGNINFSFPESGDSPLLDVFCVSDTSPTYGEVAGRVNLNTRQAPVLAALLSGVLLDKDNSATPVLTQAMASDLAKDLVARTSATTITSTTQGPLMSRADLVGTWMGPPVAGPASSGSTSGGKLKASIPPDPNTFYTGFSYDIGTVNSVKNTPTVSLILRQRDSVMRALVDSGTTRTWNVLIDLVAQSGRFPPTALAAGAAGLPQFVVEGEKHYWLHVAIDRYTGKVIDSQLEVVRE